MRQAMAGTWFVEVDVFCHRKTITGSGLPCISDLYLGPVSPANPHGQRLMRWPSIDITK
ncbi:hypothetical protein GCM10007386_30350 [Pseudoduganella dura]|nr:hypothetical protein GCM10007386_30350 [Pseudoduganella dura]